MTDSRDAILSALIRAHVEHQRTPVRYGLAPDAVPDFSALFTARAIAERAEILEIASQQDVPMAVARTLQRLRAQPRIHMPANSPLRALAWHRAPQLVLADTPPGREDSAVSAADYAIAETGSLAFFAAPDRPASAHFLPGREFVVLTRGQVLPSLEDVLALASAQGMPSTINIVTGPSRTGDIEQAIEFGAHGPKQLFIILCD